MHAYMHTCTHAYMPCIHAYMRICMYAYIHVCMHVCMYVCMYACVRVHVCMYACVHVCMYACMYALWPYGSGCCCHDVLTPSRPCAVCHDDGCWVCSSEHGLVGISCSYIRSRLSSGRLHAACHRNPCCHFRCERAPVKDFCVSLCAFSAAQVAPPSPCRAGRPWARRILTRTLLVPSSPPCAPSGRPCTGSWFLCAQCTMMPYREWF